jgi:hypothetical protein
VPASASLRLGLAPDLIDAEPDSTSSQLRKQPSDSPPPSLLILTRYISRFQRAHCLTEKTPPRADILDCLIPHPQEENFGPPPLLPASFITRLRSRSIFDSYRMIDDTRIGVSLAVPSASYKTQSRNNQPTSYLALEHRPKLDRSVGSKAALSLNLTILAVQHTT